MECLTDDWIPKLFFKWPKLCIYYQLLNSHTIPTTQKGSGKWWARQNNIHDATLPCWTRLIALERKAILTASGLNKNGGKMKGRGKHLVQSLRHPHQVLESSLRCLLRSILARNWSQDLEPHRNPKPLRRIMGVSYEVHHAALGRCAKQITCTDVTSQSWWSHSPPGEWQCVRTTQWSQAMRVVTTQHRTNTALRHF